MSAVRLLTADQAPLLARPFYGNGDPGPIVTALAHVPELLEVALPFIGAALGPSALSWRTKELVIVRVSALAGCRYCVQTHTAVALDAGLSREEILALRLSGDYREVFADAAERAVIAWSDAVAGGHGPVPDQARARLREHVADHEMVELTVVAGTTLMLNRLATALDLPTAPDTLSRLKLEDLL
ncbi:carboxymuconolactone decarboxylase family protein [Nonomuraea sp. NBC_00507]|uniref:carboxymuconolactone decarboxylase family protein n=1 Tax=Nonomuraea sp. NBC_00507 TaxID=2976002 RepID=UPI002E191B5F